jgi:TPP-dependent pyruvate/acetoin dehydrogenase alpha subunit
MELSKDQKLKLYTNLVRVRKMDEMMVKGLMSGKIVLFFHSQQGQEAVGVGACTFLRKDDYVFYSHRGHGISKLLPKGFSPRTIIAEHYGKATGSCGGMTSFHASDMELGIPGCSGTLGGDFVIAAGLGIAAKMRGKGQVVVCIEGEGTYGRGTFHETMLMAANWKLPLIWGVENNQYMGATPISEIHPKENIADLAIGYGVPGVVVDGQDVVAVYEAFQAAVDRARAGEGPSMIECKTYRFRSHAEGIPDLRIIEPRPQEEIEAWKKRDPVNVFRERLLREGVLTQTEVDRIDREATGEMEEAERLATQDPFPSDPQTLIKRALYAD